jgi:hypothetical protein
MRQDGREIKVDAVDHHEEEYMAGGQPDDDEEAKEDVAEGVVAQILGALGKL